MRLLLVLLFISAARTFAADPLTLSREDHWLIIKGAHLPGEVKINYLEAYCRPGSTDADWVKHTVIPHKTELISNSPEKVIIRDTLQDGVIVDHQITARA